LSLIVIASDALYTGALSFAASNGLKYASPSENGEGQVKLTDEQLLKLNQASSLLAEVRVQLLRQCVTMPDDDPEKTGWTPLFQLESKLNVFILQMKQN
jgi:hypothetical protein